MIIRKTHQRIRVCFLCLFLVFTMLLTVGAVSAAASADGVKTVGPVNQSDNYSAVLYDNTNGLPAGRQTPLWRTATGRCSAWSITPIHSNKVCAALSSRSLRYPRIACRAWSAPTCV